jgi:hypothetical protein
MGGGGVMMSLDGRSSSFMNEILSVAMLGSQ